MAYMCRSATCMLRVWNIQRLKKAERMRASRLRRHIARQARRIERKRNSQADAVLPKAKGGEQKRANKMR